MRELLSLDKQLRSIRGSLKVKVGENVQLDQRIKRENINSRKVETIRIQQWDPRGQIADLNDYLSVRQKSIDLLKAISILVEALLSGGGTDQS